MGLRLSSLTCPAGLVGGAFFFVEAHPSLPKENPQTIGALGGFCLELTAPAHWGCRGISANADDYFATETERLIWLETPYFEAIAIDERGEPLRIVVTDPRVWVVHRLWLSKRKDRKPLGRRRDREMAHAVGRLVVEYMPHLQFASEQLQMLPKSLFKEAAHLFGR